jgi:hypothetical protein
MKGIWGNMVDGFHILMWNRIKKPILIGLHEVGRESRGRDSEGDVLYKYCHYESSLYNKYILIKKFRNWLYLLRICFNYNINMIKGITIFIIL